MVFIQSIISNFLYFLSFLFPSDKERNNWPTRDEHYKAVQRGVFEAGTLLMVLPSWQSFAATFYCYLVCIWQMINEWWNPEFWLDISLSIQKGCILQLFPELPFLLVVKEKFCLLFQCISYCRRYMKLKLGVNCICWLDLLPSYL